MVRSCIAHGADVNQRDRDGWTPLMTAAYLDNADGRQGARRARRGPNALSRQNFTPLGIATQYGKNDAALALIAVGRRSRPRRSARRGYTPLMLATRQRRAGAGAGAARKGADVNADNSGGVTALMIAAAEGRADMVELLMHAGANINAQTERGDTALSIARAKGEQKVIKLLGESSAPSREPKRSRSR